MVPRTKAMMSVSEVTVIEAPARASVLAIRSGTSISTPPLVRVRVKVRVRVGAGVRAGVRVGVRVQVGVVVTLVMGGNMARP